VRRMCSRKPARPAYCSEIAVSSASRSGSGRKAQRTSGSQYQAVTELAVNVRCPAISLICRSIDGLRSLGFFGLGVRSSGVFFGRLAGFCEGRPGESEGRRPGESEGRRPGESDGRRSGKSEGRRAGGSTVRRTGGSAGRRTGGGG